MISSVEFGQRRINLTQFYCIAQQVQTRQQRVLAVITVSVIHVPNFRLKNERTVILLQKDHLKIMISIMNVMIEREYSGICHQATLSNICLTQHIIIVKYSSITININIQSHTKMPNKSFILCLSCLSFRISARIFRHFAL